MNRPSWEKYVDEMNSLRTDGINLLDEAQGLNIFDAWNEEKTGIFDVSRCRAWQARCENIIRLALGRDSTYLEKFDDLNDLNYVTPESILLGIQLLEAASSDTQKRLVVKLDFSVASVVFNSVLDQANYLNSKTYKDAAAVLGRTVLEDALKRLARDASIDDSQRASKINEDLKKATVYDEPMCRQVQAWLSIGNSAAHAKFDEYDQQLVRHMLAGIKDFLRKYFSGDLT